MVHNIEKTVRVKIPASKIWDALADYSGVENFALTITSSPIIGDISSGKGAKRRCTFNDGSTLVEEIVEYAEGSGYKMKLSDFSYPLKSMVSEIRVSEVDSETSDLYMSTQFVPKGGPLGWLMGTFMMGPMMKSVFGKLLTGLGYYCVTGKRIDEKMPPKEEFDFLV